MERVLPLKSHYAKYAKLYSNMDLLLLLIRLSSLRRSIVRMGQQDLIAAIMMEVFGEKLVKMPLDGESEKDGLEGLVM